MRDDYTAGAQRALERALEIAIQRGTEAVDPIDLLLALLEEPESQAAALLEQFGVAREAVQERALTRVGGLASRPERGASADPIDDPPRSAELRGVLGSAASAARGVDRRTAVGTEHLLVGMTSIAGQAADVLTGLGLEHDELRSAVESRAVVETGPIPLTEEAADLKLADPAELGDLGRLIDAAANRAREGLRVVEDYVRFVRDDPGLTRRLKEMRHRFDHAIRGFDPNWLIESRDTPNDVGTHIMAFDEGGRESARAVLAANLKRSGEALRSLEEYTKLQDTWLSGRFEVLRYDLYTIEKRLMAAVAAQRSLADARLYVIVGGAPTLGDLTWIVEEAIAGGAQVIQHRDKTLVDRDMIKRAIEVRKRTEGQEVVFIVNDRADIARIVGADGLHLGQTDLNVGEARRVLGPNRLIGRSTHSPEQLEAAIAEGANYLGVGPVFESRTKTFDAYAGLDYVRAAAGRTSLPWFAIGGITPENLETVIEAGARRVAVASAVSAAERPRDAARALRDRLEQAAERLAERAEDDREPLS